MTPGSGARGGWEGAGVPGLGEQREAGRGDGRDTGTAMRDTGSRAGGSGGLRAARMDRGARPADVPGDLVVKEGADRQERSGWAKVRFRARGRAPRAICPLLIKMPMFKRSL